MDTPERPNSGLYNHKIMRYAYDPFVRRVSHRFIWRFPQPLIDRIYALAGQEHVEVGPGSGSALAGLPRSTAVRKVHLLDINPACLDIAEQRISSRFDKVWRHQAGALSPWPIADRSVDSVAAFDVLHCLPGESIMAKKDLITNAKRILRPGGHFIGGSVMRTEDSSGVARWLMHRYQEADNVFHNSGDQVEDLKALLDDDPEWANVRVKVRGSIAVWIAQRGDDVEGV